MSFMAGHNVFAHSRSLTCEDFASLLCETFRTIGKINRSNTMPCHCVVYKDC